MLRCGVSTAGPTLIHSSVKLKLTQLYSKCWSSLLQRMSHKTRLRNQTRAMCTGAYWHFFLLYNICDNVVVPVQKHFKTDNNNHNGPKCLGPFSKSSLNERRLLLAEFRRHNWCITCCSKYHIMNYEPMSSFLEQLGDTNLFMYWWRFPLEHWYRFLFSFGHFKLSTNLK